MRRKHIISLLILYFSLVILFPQHTNASSYSNAYTSTPTITRGTVVLNETTEISYFHSIALSYTYNIPDDLPITSGILLLFQY